MIVKCLGGCGYVRKGRSNKACPSCNSKIRRVTSQELQSIGDNIIPRMRAAAAICNAHPPDNDMKLAAFMAVFHNRHLNRSQIQAMRG